MLYICGSGVKTISHLTKETESYIKNSDLVLYLVNESISAEYIKTISKKYFDLNEIYCESDNLKKNYHAVADKVISECQDSKKITVIFYGHPVYGVEITQSIINSAKKENIKYNVLPAISSFDCLMSDLLLDPFSSGIQIYEANYLLKYDIVLNKTVPLVIVQIAMIDCIQNLYHKISSTYSDEDQVYFYIASLYPSINSTIKSVKLKDLESVTKVHKLDTLCLIPKHSTMLN